MNHSSRQGWVLLAQCVLTHAIRQAIEHDRHWNAGATDHRLTVEHGRVRRDQVEKLGCHATMVAPERAHCCRRLGPNEDHLDAGLWLSDDRTREPTWERGDRSRDAALGRAR